MLSPLRIRTLYYLVAGFCYLIALFLMWQVGRADRSSETQVVTLAINIFGMGLSQVVATLICRAFGYSLERQTETRLETPLENLQPECVELRSYQNHKLFKFFAELCLALQGAIALLLFAAWVGVYFYGSHFFRYQLEHWYVVPLFLLPLAGLFAVMSYRARGGIIVAKTDDEGLEIRKVGEKPIHINWSEIGSARKIENVNIFGDVTYSYVELKDASGKVRTRVTLNNSPIERQQQFSQVVSQYLAGS